jgi:suppressor of fused protein SUFU
VTEETPGGSTVYRHGTRTSEFELAQGDEETIAAVDAHIARYLGEVEGVWHEIVSDLVHIDVHVVPPSGERDFYSLVTSGMSARPMSVPAGSDLPEYAELMVHLPAGWPLNQDAFQDERNYWPIRLLKVLARLPHEYDTWLGLWHTIPNGDPPEPYADGTTLCCAFITPTVVAAAEFDELVLPSGKRIAFYQVVPLHADEMNLKLAGGTEALLARMNEAQVSGVVEPDRPSCA